MFKRYVYLEGLTTLLGSSGKFLINNDGQIRNAKGNELQYRRDDDGNKVVTCLSWDGERDYRVIDLVALQFKNLQIPKSRYGEVSAFAMDGDPENTHARNVGYRFTAGPIPYEGKQGFFYVPGFPFLAISLSGSAISVKTNHELTAFITKNYQKKNIKGGYKTFNTRFAKGKSTNALRHRLLCLTFLPYPDNVDSLTVNHINGTPGDDRLENLEWATRGENNLHAYVNDLKNQHKRVLVRDITTGKVTEYYSISECARQLGYPTDETVRQRLISSEFGKIFHDGTQIKFKNDPRPWIDVDCPEDVIAASKLAMGISVLVRNCSDLSVKEYPSIASAGTALEIEASSIKYRLAVGNKAPMFGYQFKLATDVADWPSFTIKEYRDSLKPNSFKVDARNLLSGEKKTYKSINKAEAEHNLGFLNGRLKSGNQPLYESGWQFKLADQEWEDVVNVDEVLYKLRKDVMAREESTGKTIICANAERMSKLLGLDPKAIRQAAFTRGNKLYRGYRFRLGVSTDPWPSTRSEG